MPGDETPRRSPLVRAASIGAAWGFGGYLLLWGYTPLVVHRAFVLSAIGTILLLPVRMVLFGIHRLEAVAGRPFELSESHGWIGLAAAAAGAVLAIAVAWLVGAALRALGQAGRASRSARSASGRNR